MLVRLSFPILLLVCLAGFSGKVAAFSAITTDLSDSDFFKSDLVCRIQIKLSSDALAGLRHDARRYVRATVHVADRDFEDIGLHLKGHGSFRTVDDKPSFTLDFNRFGKGRGPGELDKIHLNNSAEDATFLNELLGSELFAATHVPSPRVTHALVELNGRRLGLYVLKEGFSESFLRRNFGRANGTLYEPKGKDIDAMTARR